MTDENSNDFDKQEFEKKLMNANLKIKEKDHKMKQMQNTFQMLERKNLTYKVLIEFIYFISQMCSLDHILVSRYF